MNRSNRRRRAFLQDELLLFSDVLTDEFIGQALAAIEGVWKEPDCFHSMMNLILRHARLAATLTEASGSPPARTIGNASLSANARINYQQYYRFR
jgi:hypothetical protein